MRKRATTTIFVNDERWKVPRGFGAAYKREAQQQLELIAQGKPGAIVGAIQDLMALVGYAPTVAAIADWPLRKRVEAVVYAVNVHLRASDNAIQRHPDLEWLPESWKGTRAERPAHIRPDLWGAFDGPTPTEIHGMNDNANTERIYTTPELAERWRVSRQTVANAIRAGRLQAFRVGKRSLRIREAEVIRYEQQQNAEGA